MVDRPFNIYLAGKAAAVTAVSRLMAMTGDTVTPLPAAFTPNVSATGRFGMQNAGGMFLYESYSTRPSQDFGIGLRLQSELSYTGGDPGVISLASVTATAGENVGTDVWSGLFVLHNYAETSARNVALYAQATRYDGAAITWATCDELRDHTVDPLAGACTKEIDLWAFGIDSHGNRVVVDIVGGPIPGFAGVAPTISYGIRIGPVNGDQAQATFSNGLTLTGNVTNGISIASDGTYGVKFTSASAYVIGIDFSAATMSTAAMRLAAGQRIELDASGLIAFGYETSGTKATLKNSSTERFAVSLATGAISVNGTQVLAARNTGWVADTGTAKKTSSATYTSPTASAIYAQAEMQAVMASLQDVSQTVKALKDTLIGVHGLIGA